MEKGTLSIHSENILPIIKKWLYSEKDIFIRELVSNSCDAISKVKFLRSKNTDAKTPEEYRIDISVDKDKKLLIFSDNGIGMTAEEIKNYIAQIAFSGAEEFLKKYSSNNEKDQFIGHFGLGFYSSYMVSDKVDIHTLSHENKAKGVFWSCDGSSEYTLENKAKDTVGTEIILHINKDSEEFLDIDRLKQILLKYCPYLPYAIYLNNEHINNKDPIWIKNASELGDNEYKEAYRDLYPFEPDPIFWVPINVDFPFHVKGMLYFPKIAKNFDFNKHNLKLFCNRVFVSDNCKDLMPDYLTILRGAIDSPDIPLNVSRSYLQMDSTVRQLSNHIAKKLADKLLNLYQTDKEKFITLWPDIEVIIKLGVLQDMKFFDRAKPFLIFKNTDGEWTTADEYLTRNKDKTDNKIFYIQKETTSHSLLKIFKDKQIEVLEINPTIDTAIINQLEAKLNTKFQRVDSALDDAMLDKTKEDALLDSDGKTLSSKLAEWIKKALAKEHLEVEAKSLADDSLPGFLMIKEEERRLRDYFNLTRQDPLNLPMGKTFVVNTNSSLIQKANRVYLKDPDLAEKLMNTIYDLTLLTQREMPPEDLSDIVNRTHLVLEQLIKTE